MSPSSQLLRLGDALAEFRQDADAAHEARVSGKPRGPITGLSTLDNELSGAFAPGLHFVHGQPGTGKTAFGLQVAAEAKCPAMFVTCEMAPPELLRRHTARTTDTYLGRLKSGEMDGETAEALALRAIKAAPDMSFADATRMTIPAFPRALKPTEPNPNLFEFAQIVRGESKHLLIVLDSLHTWTQSTSAGVSEYEALNSAIYTLQTLASQLRCPILIISERNRDSMKTGGLNAGAGTRKIEYQGESVIDLSRTSDVSEGMNEAEVTVTLSKNRHGVNGKKIHLLFSGALQRFREA
jgi:replicative DNA helicase